MHVPVCGVLLFLDAGMLLQDLGRPRTSALQACQVTGRFMAVTLVLVNGRLLCFDVW